MPGQQGSEARLTQPGPTGPGVRVWLSHVFLGRVTASLSAHTPALPGWPGHSVTLRVKFSSDSAPAGRESQVTVVTITV